jgi:glycosyltransferase involved in cell wall biosynthesis
MRCGRVAHEARPAIALHQDRRGVRGCGVKIGIATVYTPRVRGGAELLADGLTDALHRHGHSVHKLVTPFEWDVAAIHRTIDLWSAQDFAIYHGAQIDRFICLKFPCYMLRHPNAVIWLLHQHRAAYELYGTPWGLDRHDIAQRSLAERIRAADSRALREAEVFTISARVSARLEASHRIASTVLYPPPQTPDQFYCAAAQPFILAPSRLESIKRQELLIRALVSCRTQALAVIVGDGGRRETLERLAEQCGVRELVRFLGSVSRPHLIHLYANCTAVFFGPIDEDLGYVTLEAMLASKPVITCEDSGGPLEFVRHAETGWITAPEPAAVAAAIEDAFADPERTARMGRAGRAAYEDLELSWDKVVHALLQQT